MASIGRINSRLGCEQHDTLALVKDEPLDQHQTDEGLAKTHAVTKERTAVLPGDLHERPVRLLLIAIKVREHARPSLVPLGRGQLVPPEELLQSLRVDIEWRIQVRVARDRLDDGLGDVSRFVPVRLEPLLKLRDLARALDLDIQFDILRVESTVMTLPFAPHPVARTGRVLGSSLPLLPA